MPFDPPNKELLTLLTVFMSGLFGLLVAVVTAKLGSSKEATAHERKTNRDSYEEIRSAYVGYIASLEKLLHATVHSAEIPTLWTDLASTSALVALVGKPAVIDQSVRMGNMYQAWTRRSGFLPNTGGSSTLPAFPSLVPAEEFPLEDEALRELVLEEYAKLQDAMRKHLTELRARLQ